MTQYQRGYKAARSLQIPHSDCEVLDNNVSDIDDDDASRDVDSEII